MLDTHLKQFATDRQWEVLKALAEHGTSRKAGRALGMSKTSVNGVRVSVLRKAARQGYAPDYDMTRPAAPGFNVKGTSTLYGPDGEIKNQWVKTGQDKEQQEEAFRAAIEAFTDNLPKEKPISAPKNTNSNLMACYPVGDHHTGMLSWDKETGQDYDLEIAEKLLMGAINHLVGMAPSCDRATLVFLGDFMHYDSFETVTPKSRNQLDADSRFPKMVKVAIRSMRYLIQRALSQHKEVHVIVEIGNHDLSSSIFLTQCLDNIYEFEPRVTIDTSPAHYHYFTFGKNLVGVHHGHNAKMPQLPMIMAADRPEEWGKSKYRYWWTGHVHHDQAKDFHGTKVESFRVLAPNDAWAAQEGYRAMQDMKCVILHEEYGEVSRHTVNPEMLK